MPALYCVGMVRVENKHIPEQERIAIVVKIKIDIVKTKEDAWQTSQNISKK